MADSSALRRLVYALLITLAASAVLARIVAVVFLIEPYLYSTKDTPPNSGFYRPWPETRPLTVATLSSNDRSRWATIRALVENGTYVIGHRTMLDESGRKYEDAGIIMEDGWYTVDKVMNPETHDFYSSKPPLLPAVLAGEYWLMKNVLGWSLKEQPFLVVRTVLLTVNWLPLLLYLLLFSRLLERFGTTDWGRLYVMTAACFGTFVTPFCMTLNNHTVATWCVLFSLYTTFRIWYENDRRFWLFALTGLLAGFAACTELPAASFAAVLFVALLLRAPRSTLLFFVPALLLPVAAFFVTNYLALGMWRPAYSEFGGPWYEYDGSNWKPDPQKAKRGIDWARLREGKIAYAFHLLLGHHGLFSLTPVNLLALAGMCLGLRQVVRRWQVSRTQSPESQARFAWLFDPALGLSPVAVAGLVISVTVFGFYWIRTDNYGGWTCGPRWFMWLTPFWLLAALPVADRLGERRGGRLLGYVLLSISVLSASYAAWNPWRHPWLYNLMDYLGWIEY